MMDDVSSVWVSLVGIILTAVIASGGTLLASRWATRNERQRLRQEMIDITGNDRQRLVDETDRARRRANEVDAELEKVRDERRAMADEFATFRIASREALAEKETVHRQAMLDREVLHRQAMEEKEVARRELALQLQRAEGQLEECGRELNRSRQENERLGDLVRAQATVIAEYRARHPDPQGG